MASLFQDLMLGFAPCLFWLWWIRLKDRLNPEPRALVLRVFALGAASTLLVLLARPGIEDWLLGTDQGLHRAVLDAFVVTAPIEELAKIAAVVCGVLWHEKFDEPLDGIVYGAAAGLGFASVENTLFLQQSGDTGLIVARAFTATLAHVATSGSFGFLLGLARFARGGARVGYAAAGAVLAIGFHGAYNLFLIADGNVGWAALVCVLPLMLVAFGLKVRWAQTAQRHARS